MTRDIISVMMDRKIDVLLLRNGIQFKNILIYFAMNSFILNEIRWLERPKFTPKLDPLLKMLENAAGTFFRSRK